jgi:hypothetical protein
MQTDYELGSTQALKAQILRIEDLLAKLRRSLSEMYDRQHFLEKYSAEQKLETLKKELNRREREFYRYIEE